MGTYTTNKELFMPSVGEQGWGTLVNGNFETIDTFLKPIAVSGSTYTFTGNQTGGSINATSITNNGTSTFTGKITANSGIGTTFLTTSSTITSAGLITGNGGFEGTLTGNVTGNVTGKINVSSVGTNSNNIKICTLTATKQTLQGVNTLILSPSQVTVTRLNTSFLNCTLTDEQLKSKASGTCSWTWSIDSNSTIRSSTCTFTATDDLGNIVLNKKVSLGKDYSIYSATISFTRNYGTTYTLVKTNETGTFSMVSTVNGTVYAG